VGQGGGGMLPVVATAAAVVGDPEGAEAVVETAEEAAEEAVEEAVEAGAYTRPLFS